MIGYSLLHEVGTIWVNPILKLFFSLRHMSVSLCHQPSHTTIIRSSWKKPQVESRNGHDVVPKESKPSNESEEVKTFAPAGKDSTLIATILDETPGFREREHRHDVRGKFSADVSSVHEDSGSESYATLSDSVT